MKDMRAKTRAAAGVAASLTMVASMTAVPALAVAPDADGTGDAPASCEAVQAGVAAAAVKVADVQGAFAWDQSAITPNETIRSLFQKTVKALCGAQIPVAVENPLNWEITVSGAVDVAYTASVGELAEDDAVQRPMTCTCGGNPAGGKAIVTAEVKGVPVEAMLSRAGVQPGANAVTFVSSDGARTVLPLGYVIGRHGVISYEINEEDLSASVGGNNQLWLARTPANYFARDVVEIIVSAEEKAPAVPDEEAAHPNSPNAGVLAGAQE